MQDFKPVTIFILRDFMQLVNSLKSYSMYINVDGDVKSYSLWNVLVTYYTTIYLPLCDNHCWREMLARFFTNTFSLD